MDGGNNMNPMQSFMQGAQYGTHLRQQKQAKEVNSLASLGKLHDARTKATEYGMSGRANDLAAQIRAMNETDRRQRAEVTGAIASIAGAALKLPIEQRFEYASHQAELLGLNPDIVGKVGSWDDASMQAIQFNALDAQKQLSHGLAVDKQNAAISDAQADNVRADNALTQAQNQFDVTTELKRENQQSLIADRDADNRREDLKMQQAQRQYAEQKGSFGKNVVYAETADGQTIAYQLNDRGDAKRVNFGEGTRVLSPQEKSKQTAIGKGLAKRELMKTKAGSYLSTAKEKMLRIKTSVNEAKKLSTGGNTGNWQGRVTISQKAADLNAVLDTLRANIGFKELQDMRDNSPTGGALGQVTERELNFLQSLIGNLSRTQGEGRLDAELDKIAEAVEASYARIEAAYEQDYNAGLMVQADDAAQLSDPLGIR